MSRFGPADILGILGSTLFGLGEVPMSEQSRRQQAAMQQQANMLHEMKAREFAQRATEEKGNYVDAEFTVLDDPPALDHAKRLEDKRQSE